MRDERGEACDQAAADAVKSSFAPVADSRTRLLICGSLPGDRSLAAGRYYAHPQNQFWRLAGDAIGVPLAALDYQARLAALGDAGVGLWDVVGSASREGSLDASIRDIAANDLAALAGRLPMLRTVAFNGGKAAAIGQRLLAERPDLRLIALPSSSPALTWPYARKLEMWRALREVIG